MNIVALSNWFNLIAQQVGFLGYHYGFESDMNRNVTNNLNPANSVGNRFPFVLFEKPSYTSTFLKAVQTKYQCRLNFYALQHYNSDASINTDQTIEQENTLRGLVIDFLTGVIQVGKANNFSIETSTINFDIQEMQTIDRCIQITATFSIYAYEECSTFVFDPNAVALPYSYPVPNDSDFEKLNN